MDYLGGPNVITRVLIREEKSVKSEKGDMMMMEAGEWRILKVE